MDGFNSKDNTRKPFCFRFDRGCTRLFNLFLGVAAALFCVAASCPAEEPTKVAVLPFEIHAAQDLSHLRQDLQAMFNTQLNALGIKITDPQVIQKTSPTVSASLGKEDLMKLGQELDVDYLIVGSLTQVGKKISLDVKAVDANGIRAPIAIFAVEENMDKLKETVAKAVKSLYNGISGLARIDSIKIKGNKRVETEAILPVITSRAGDVLDAEQLDKDFRAVMAMGFFTADSKTEFENGPQGKIVIFNVVEKPSIGVILFRGNKKIKEADLRKEANIKLYAILNQGEIKQAANRLRDYYREKGFYNAQITEKIEDKANNEVTLIFEITEESKVYVKKIVFIGNTHFSQRALRGVMETKTKGLFSFMFGTGLLEPKKLETDQQRIEFFYHNHGFIRAKTLEPQIKYGEKEKGLVITIEIVEGPQYMVDKVNIEGDLILPVDELLKKTNIKKEKFFNREILRMDVLALGDLYADAGYANIDITPLVDENDEKKLVNIKYSITKGEKMRFERINIMGNAFTRDKVIRRQLKVNEGEYFSGTGMRKSNINILQLKYFENDVELQTKKGSSDDRLILDIKVKEVPTSSIFFGAGYSSYEKASGKVMVEDRNLFGRGQDVSASVQIGGKTSQYDLKFTEPWLFDKNLSAGIDLYKLKEETDDYTKNGWGGSLRFGFPIEAIDEYTRASASYNYDSSDLWEDLVSGTTTTSGVTQQFLNHYITSSVILGMSRDNRDYPRLGYPRTGSLNAISYEYAGGFLSGDVSFGKLLVTSEWYFPTFLETAVHVKGSWGYIQRHSDGVLPIYRKFFLGGIKDVRGFKEYSITPKDPLTGRGIGGEKKMVYNLEYLFPVYKRQGVSGVIFFDAGNVYTEDENYSFSNLKKSFGAGIRWMNALFPIRLEYGKVISPKDDEPSGNWEFMIGQLF